MDYIRAIDDAVKNGVPHSEIARKIFLTYPTKAFVGQEEAQFEILNEIAVFFHIPITSVQVAGSAKTGRSFYQQRDFTPKFSDLDIAIIDLNLYTKYCEISFRRSKGYSDLTKFPLRSNKRTFDEYIRYLTRGIVRPDLMPTGPERAEFKNFFGKLSAKHLSLFSNINAAIYQSQAFFEDKQRSAIQSYLNNRPI